MSTSPSQLGIGQVAPLGQGRPSPIPEPAANTPSPQPTTATPTTTTTVVRKPVQRPPDLRAVPPPQKNPITVKTPRTLRVRGSRAQAPKDKGPGKRRAPKQPDNGLNIFTDETPQRFKMLRSFKKGLFGQPPARVVENRPPLISLAIWRWLYFWFYVTFRIYKASWLNWMPVPRPSPIHRLRRAHKRMKQVRLHVAKVIASFSKKGGVGKTSLIKAATGILKRVFPQWNVSVHDNNPDRGTLADRGARTTQYCVEDLVANQDYVVSYAAYARYCNEMPEGSLLLASTRPDDYQGELNISAEDFMAVDAIARRYLNVMLLDCGTDTKSAASLLGLNSADVIWLITTSAMDSLEQTKNVYVWMRKYPHINNKHIILVVNRRHFWTNLDAIKATFLDMAAHQFEKEGNKHPYTPKSFHVMGVGWDPRLALGRKFNSRQLRLGVQADITEIEALSLELVADHIVGQPELTHLQQQPGADPPATGTATPDSADDRQERNPS